MIALASDYLVFQMATGESVPCSAEVISVELADTPVGAFDPHVVQQAASAVFYYFRHELGRQTVSVGEFAGALQRVLRSLGAVVPASARASDQRRVPESDLCRLARESGPGGELFFFPRLRAELSLQLLQAPRIVRFHGLRGCVKQLAGAQRWSPRCRNLEAQIVAYLRGCLSAEGGRLDSALLVE
jgi:hypothetical protein